MLASLILDNLIPVFVLTQVLSCNGYCPSRWEEYKLQASYEPCNGVCQKQLKYDDVYDTNLQMSRDGKSCSKCETEGAFYCPNCQMNQYWCTADRSCKELTMPCNEECPSHIFPMFNKETQICETCDQHFEPSCLENVIDPFTHEYICLAWCPEMGKCINVSTDDGGSETCSTKCFSNYSGYYDELWLCPETSKCIRKTSACGYTCSDKYQYFCPKDNECQSKSLPCDGECEDGKRYCPRYLIDDFIGDGRGSCLDYDKPCGEQCEDGKYFCLATNSCLQNIKDCQCAAGKWPAHSCGPVERCSLLANQTLPTTVRRCSILVSETVTAAGTRSKSTGINGGDCHPNYVFCEDTQACTPLLYSSCGYLDWLRAFQLTQCVKKPKRWIKTCVENELQKEYKWIDG